MNVPLPPSRPPQTGERPGPWQLMDAIATLATEGWSGPEFAGRFLRLLEAGLPLDGALVWRRTPAGWQVLAAVGLRTSEWFRQASIRSEQAEWLRQAGQSAALWRVPPEQLLRLGATATDVVALIPTNKQNPPTALLQVHLSSLRLHEPLEATLAYLVDAAHQAGAAFEFAGIPRVARVEPEPMSITVSEPPHGDVTQSAYTLDPEPHAAADHSAAVEAPISLVRSTVSPGLAHDSPPHEHRTQEDSASHHPAPWDLAGLLAVSQSLQRELGVRAVAHAAANDGRTWLNTDRVSVWIRRRGRWRALAVSGQPQVHRQSPIIRGLRRFLPLVIGPGRPFHAETDGAELPETQQQRLTELLLETGSRDLLVVPLLPPDNRPLRTNATTAARPHTRPAFAALVIERLRDADWPADWTDRAAALADCVALPLWNARRYERLFLQPVWRGIGALWAWVTDGRLMRTTAVIVLVTTVIASLILVPWEYRVEGTGRLMPVERRELFAPQDAEVVDVLVHSGDQVSAGTPLVQLRNRELDQQTIARTKELDEQRQLLQSLRSQRDQATRRADREAEIRLQGQLIATQAQVEGLDREVVVLRERQAALQLVAPMAGTVATFQIDQLLRFRPVRRGEVLLTVMNEAGPWRLELDVEEARVGPLLAAQQRAAETAAPLTVDVLLVTQPEQSFVGTVAEVATATTTDERDGLMLQVLANLDASTLPQRRIGAEVRGRIRCGKQPLGYVLFGDVWEFLLRRTWWW